VVVFRALLGAIGWCGALAWRLVIVAFAAPLAAAGPCALLALAALLLLYSSQGAELGRSADEAGWRGTAGLLLACVIWSLMSWYWSRRLLDRTFGDRDGWVANAGGKAKAPKLDERLARIGLSEGEALSPGQVRLLRRLLAFQVNWLPRVLALMPFCIAAMMLGEWSQPPKVMAALAVVAAIILAALLVRRRVSERFKVRVPPSILALLAAFFSVATIAVFLHDPIVPSQSLGTIAVVFLFFAALLPIVAYLSIGTAKWRLPGFALVALALFALPALQPGRHDIRSLHDPVPTNRLALQPAVTAWIGSQRHHEKNPPLVVVTTAGGGISAAVWTGLLLAALQDQDPRFASRIFAISAVSGGALGAATFVASIPPLRVSTAAGRAPCENLTLEHLPACQSFGTVHAALSQDFLAPTVAAYLFADTFGPTLAWLLGDRIPNRAAALEQVWENACALAGCPALAGSIHRLRAGLDWRPALFLNGTHVESGKRVVTSPLALTMEHFDDALDFFHLHGRDIRVSTAVLNAARFPYVTPVGRIIGNDRTPRGHVADGGYFENYGAETGAEVLRAALGVLRTFPNTVRPVVIEISSDPALTSRDLARGRAFDMRAACGTAGGDALVTISPDMPLPIDCAEREGSRAPQLLGPADVLLATRSARGVQTTRRVWRQAVAAGGTAVQFTLCRQGEDPERPPLGWSLSQATLRAIAEDVADIFNPTESADGCRNANRHALRRLLWALSPEPEPHP
jgi:hypothetical protein